MRSLVLIAAVLLPALARAEQLDVPFTGFCGDGEAADHAIMIVSGLKPGGDGFLAVRSGPGSEHRKLAELHNGDAVTIMATSGKWKGVVYGREQSRCEGRIRILLPGTEQGWVHGSWLIDGAG